MDTVTKWKARTAPRHQNRRADARFAWLLALVVAGIVGLGSHPARADDLSLLLNGKAYHMPHDEYGYLNEKNWGVGLQYDYDKGGDWVPFLNVSEFKDSNFNFSYYFGGGLMRRYRFNTDIAHFNVDVGGVAFLMHRKGYQDGDLFPGILPALTVGTDRVAVNITYIPKVEPKMVALWFLQLKIRIGQY